MGWLRDFLTLLALARQRFRSDEHYRRFQAYQGTLLVRFLQEQSVNLERHVLDLGCGNGGYSRALRAAGAEVISLDLFRPGAPLPLFIQGDALSLPFADNTFPFVFCASLIEHVRHPSVLLREIKRVTCPGALAYISFPPFYSPVGGHQFKPYHLLGERLAIRLSGCGTRGFATCFGDWGLYPLRISQVRRLIGEVGWQIRNMSTRFLPLNVAQIPLAGEFLTWHVQFVVRKLPDVVESR
jgi:SAM-dependent methyltransferase